MGPVYSLSCYDIGCLLSPYFNIYCNLAYSDEVLLLGASVYERYSLAYSYFFNYSLNLIDSSGDKSSDIVSSEILTFP